MRSWFCLPPSARLPIVPLVLALAFAARFAVGLATDSVLWPDEIFQALEQSHRLVFGVGMIPWEFEYGIRSWSVPLAIATVLKPLQLLGLDSPDIYQPLVKAALSAVSLVLPFSVYRVSQMLFDEGTARLALVFTAFWYELVSYGHRTTIDVLATYAAFAALALLFSSRRRAAIVACGALIGLTIVLRFQLLPMIGVMALVALWRWRWDAWSAGVACLAVLIAGGALDYYTWNVWFSSIVVNAQLNVAEDVASAFGRDPFWWYVPVIIVLSGGLAVAGGIGLLLSWRSSWPLLVTGAVTLAAYSAIAHKETRYVVFLIPVWLIGLAALAANRGERIARLSPRLVGLAPWVGRAAIAVFVVNSALGLLHALPMQNRGMNPAIARNDVRAAHRAIAGYDDVTGVLNLLELDENNAWDLAPYYDLHLNVPIYWPLGIEGFNAAKADPEGYASHVMTAASRQGLAGFRRLQTVGTVTIWRRVTDPPSTIPPPGYTTRMWVPPVRSRPVVNPRW